MNARIERTAPWCRAVLLALLVLPGAACTSVHEAPQGGTETGNPPVIDASLISLVVSQDEVHVRGARGAATPGATIEVTSTLTGAVFRGRAASDGSFDIQVGTPATDSFEVRATLGGQSSSSVQVVRGGTSVGQGDASVAEGDASMGGGGQALSCTQRDEMARVQMGAAVTAADTQCVSDEDCVFGRAHTLCSDSCFDKPVSTAGAQELEQARAAIESGLCADFVADGCQKVFLPCLPAPTGPVGCREGRCQIVEEPSADCGSPFDPGTGSGAVTVYWFHARSGVCVSGQYTGSGGNANRYASLQACEAACSRSGACPPNRVETEFCVEPGAPAGCARSATGCALLCAEPGLPCEDELPGAWCTPRGLCEVSSPE